MRPSTRNRLQLAAELRAAGASWNQIGSQFQLKAKSCQQWTMRYREPWQELYQKAHHLRITELAHRSKIYPFSAELSGQISVDIPSIQVRPNIERNSTPNRKPIVKTKPTAAPRPKPNTQPRRDQRAKPKILAKLDRNQVHLGMTWKGFWIGVSILLLLGWIPPVISGSKDPLNSNHKPSIIPFKPISPEPRVEDRVPFSSEKGVTESPNRDFPGEKRAFFRLKHDETPSKSDGSIAEWEREANPCDSPMDNRSVCDENGVADEKYCWTHSPNRGR